jgi:hypothetical protein
VRTGFAGLPLAKARAAATRICLRREESNRARQPAKRRGDSFVAIGLFNKALHFTRQRGELAPLSDGLGGETPVLEGMAIALRRAGRGAAIASGSARYPGPRPGRQRGLKCMANLLCTGLFLGFRAIPRADCPSCQIPIRR